MRIAILTNTAPAYMQTTVFGADYCWLARGGRRFLLYYQTLTQYTIAPHPKDGPWIFKRSRQCVYLWS